MRSATLSFQARALFNMSLATLARGEAVVRVRFCQAFLRRHARVGEGGVIGFSFVTQGDKTHDAVRNLVL